MTPSTIENLADAQFVALTTFRRDGRAVPTPVWVVPFDGGLGVWTPGSSGKVKRIRRDGAVTLAPCTRGGTPQGDAVPAPPGCSTRPAPAGSARPYGGSTACWAGR